MIKFGRELTDSKELTEEGKEDVMKFNANLLQSSILVRKYSYLN